MTAATPAITRKANKMPAMLAPKMEPKKEPQKFFIMIGIALQKVKVSKNRLSYVSRLNHFKLF
jgi:hypothetical protein